MGSNLNEEVMGAILIGIKSNHQSNKLLFGFYFRLKGVLLLKDKIFNDKTFIIMSYTLLQRNTKCFFLKNGLG